MLHWYVVHRRNKRLTPVAQAFREFLLKDGARLIEQAIGTGSRGGGVRRRKS